MVTQKPYKHDICIYLIIYIYTEGQTDRSTDNYILDGQMGRLIGGQTQQQERQRQGEVIRETDIDIHVRMIQTHTHIHIHTRVHVQGTWTMFARGESRQLDRTEHRKRQFTTRSTKLDKLRTKNLHESRMSLSLKSLTSTISGFYGPGFQGWELWH